MTTQEITTPSSMTNNTLQDLSQIASFGGCEFATFKPKPDVSEEQLRTASKRMELEFLRLEDGFLGHALLRGSDGVWADVVFTATEQHARDICERFMANSACLAYLELITEGSAHLSFWSRIK